MNLKDVGKHRAETITVNGYDIHVPRRPSNNQVLKEWRRLLRSAVNRALACDLSPLGCVVPFYPRVDTTEWDRWYRLAHRRSLKVIAFKRPKPNKLAGNTAPSRWKDLWAKDPYFTLKILALELQGADLPVVAQKIGVPVSAAPKIVKRARRVGKAKLQHELLKVLNRVRSVRVQDMEVAAMG